MADFSYDRAVLTLLNLALALLPTAETDARHTTTIRASITAYSTAVGPSSDTTKLRTLFRIEFFISNFLGAKLSKRTENHRQGLPATHLTYATLSRRQVRLEDLEGFVRVDHFWQLLLPCRSRLKIAQRKRKKGCESLIRIPSLFS